MGFISQPTFTAAQASTVATSMSSPSWVRNCWKVSCELQREGNKSKQVATNAVVDGNRSCISFELALRAMLKNSIASA